MSNEVEIYKACLTLADASISQLDKVSKKLWEKAASCSTTGAKNYHLSASDIAALARDRGKSR